MCRLSLVAPMQTHKAGFHPTGVFGAVGAAAAAVTLSLGAAQIVERSAPGAMAGGIIEYLAEGAWTKRLHAGWAAQSGIRAALLGRGGFPGRGPCSKARTVSFAVRAHHGGRYDALTAISARAG